MDSDIKFNRIGILEDMKTSIPNNFLCCGKVIHVNEKGININSNEKMLYPMFTPIVCTLI